MGADFIILVVLMALLLLSSLATVLTRNLLPSAILLALASTVVAMVLFFLGLRLAAVMELAVCVGLVTAIYASAISLLKPANEEKKNLAEERKAWFFRYLPLPVVLLAITILGLVFVPHLELNRPSGEPAGPTTQALLWDAHALDILGLVFLILAGVLGVAVLIGRREEK